MSKQPLFQMDEALDVWEIVAQEPYNHRDATHRAGVFLLMSVGRSDSYVWVQRLTKYDRNECREFKMRAKRNGIFRGRKIFCDWMDEKTGGIALMMDAMVTAGLMVRSEN